MAKEKLPGKEGSQVPMFSKERGAKGDQRLSRSRVAKTGFTASQPEGISQTRRNGAVNNGLYLSKKRHNSMKSKETKAHEGAEGDDNQKRKRMGTKIVVKKKRSKKDVRKKKKYEMN